MNEGEKLLRWYDANRRDLPWRREPTPYHVWLSEIMLQQTRVEAVITYYKRFTQALPDTAALAAAPEEQYLKLWEGLGYYSRVRNMHKAAGIVMEQYGGALPDTAAQLRTLPGIGEYTSAAIASIAFGEKIAAVDGNLLRIFARRTAYQQNIKTMQALAAAQAYYMERMGERPGDFNQALMDLGAQICAPHRMPDCAACPWREGCISCAQGRQTDFPVMPAKAARKVEEKTVLLIRGIGTAAIRRRPARGLLAGMYEFPNLPGHLSAKEALRAAVQMGVTGLRIRRLPEAKHIFTHREWHMIGYEIMADPLALPEEGMIFVSTRQLREHYALPSAFAAYAAFLEEDIDADRENL